MTGYIYLVRNLINGKGYVGQTVQSVAARFAAHKSSVKLGSKNALHSAIRKHGIDNFSVKEVIRCDHTLLNKLEKLFIKFYGTFAHTGHGYNMTDGGDSRFSIAEETRAKQRSAKLGKKLPHTPEWNLNIGAGQKGKVLTAEHRAKVRDANLGKKNGPHSEATKAKISAAQKGKKRGPQPAELISRRTAHLKGHVVSADTRAKIGAAARARFLAKQEGLTIQ